VGQDTANWTTERLAQYLGQQTGMVVTEETVRLYLHAHDSVCKRPTWTDASAKPKRKRITWETRGSVEVLLAGTTVPEPLPVHDLVEADLWSQLPADLEALLTLLPQADLYLQDEMQVAFYPTRLWCRKGRRGQRLVEAPGDNSRVYGFGLVDWREGWFDGRVAPGRTSEVFCEQVRAAVVRSKERGREARVMTDNLKTHTKAHSLLVRTMLAEFAEQLYLVYTPAYDPDANRTPMALEGLAADRDASSSPQDV